MNFYTGFYVLSLVILATSVYQNVVSGSIYTPEEKNSVEKVK
jgi:hypothetical protein